MDAGGWDPLAGSEIHGFITYSDLNCDKLMEEAATRWFRPNEIYAVLANHARFKVCAQPVENPTSGTVVLYDRKVVRNFRKDGHNWKKKKDGKTVQEAHEKLKIGTEERVHVYYARGEDDPNFFRRCYWLLDKELERIVLVHYRQTSEDNVVAAPNTEAEGADAPLIKKIHHTSPLTSVDSTSAHTEMSCSSLLAEEINSRAGSANPTDHESSLEEINTFWVELLESSMKNDLAVCGGSLTSTPQSKYESRESNNIVNTNVMSNNVITKTGNGSLNRSSDSYSHGLKDPVDLSQPLHASNLDSQSGGFKLSAPGRSPLQDNFSNDVLASQNNIGLWNYLNDDDPGLWDNQSPDMLTSLDQSGTDAKLFNIIDISPEWAYSIERTKVLVIGYFYEPHKHLATSNVYCIFGDKSVAAEIVQAGVYRCMVGPHTPGSVNFCLSLDGRTPISQVLSFEYRIMPSISSNGLVALSEDEDRKEKLQLQTRLARLLFSTAGKKLPPKLLIEGSRASNLTSISIEKEWMHLRKFASDPKGTYMHVTENLLELVLRNKLQEWLLEKVVEGSKVTPRDDQGQGAIHLCSILDYTWAIRLFSVSGFSLDFRDASGWTGLHWAAYLGREKMVAALLSAGANPSLVTDPTAESPGGYTAADLAAKQGFEGLSAYLAEQGLTAHFESMFLSKPKASARLMKLKSEKLENLSEQELCLRETLAAYRNAADAANNIQAALRERTLRLKTKAVQLANPEIEASEMVAAMRIQHAYRNYSRRKVMRAVARIQSHFRTWKTRKHFLNMRRQAMKIQAAYRGHRVRKDYQKVIWSVGVLEKAILRWRKKRKGLRGIGARETDTMKVDTELAITGEEDFFRVSREQAENRFNRSVVRVQALFRSYRAQQEYRRMKIAHKEAQLEFS